MTSHVAAALLAMSLVGQSPQKEWIVTMSEVPPSGDLAKFAGDADVIVRVTITKVTPWSIPNQRLPYVEYTAIVEDLVKGHVKFSGAGASPQLIHFVEMAGELSTPKGKIKSDREATLVAKDEAVVFLKWTDGLGQFQPWTGPHGVYKIHGLEMTAAAKSEFADQNAHMRPADFVALLKKNSKAVKD